MKLIFHMTTVDQWQEARDCGAYWAESLKTEGFIHFSTASQVIDVANFLFRGQEDLVLLCVDQDEVDVEVRYEKVEGDERRFPHVYGRVLCSQVSEVIEFLPSDDGSFLLPSEVAEHVRKGHAV